MKKRRYLSRLTYTQEQLLQEKQQIESARKDRRKFSVLYERYYEQVFLFIFKRAGEEDLTADICSQVFMKAMLGLPKYTFQGVPFSAWLYRIAINEVNQYFRQSQKQRMVSIESAGLRHLAAEVEPDAPQRDIQEVVPLLEKLSPDELQLIELRYFEQLPFKEIAAIYNITENNAKVRTYRLLQKMKHA
ncbi:MAG: sigma-70 family RNA polymerase sigma factor [Bacteroidota bacterium]